MAVVGEVVLRSFLGGGRALWFRYLLSFTLD